ncbi:SDR family NAD(P)-dependent oxidoreductase [Algiphilus sp. W345]|uniref:SDR family NAD(P)-dependent oxidoreductase n=1 Tax=Banduia mediterranea TaxID=3075609 RepID=A0ABU2WDM2_9GAMM|nr:SDR family NAD(P)-dependent oxidoreductase [Algiphilus sp. W345]MDT0495983.1 SDR family NAD(P)-dependent oxidoreductase [Algiphilus sp. W345]
MDVSTLEAIDETAAKVRTEIGDIELLFNNAGIVRGRFFWEHDHRRDTFLTMAINSLAIMYIAREFLPGMIASGSEYRVVNIASAAGLVSKPKMSVYCASKWAAVGLVRFGTAGAGTGRAPPRQSHDRMPQLHQYRHFRWCQGAPADADSDAGVRGQPCLARDEARQAFPDHVVHGPSVDAVLRPVADPRLGLARRKILRRIQVHGGLPWAADGLKTSLRRSAIRGPF